MVVKMIKIILFVLMGISSVNLAAQTNVLAISGSLREDSYNSKLVIEASRMASDLGANVVIFNLKTNPIPFYDGDLETKEGMPENAVKLRQLMLSSDLIIIASPSYNGSMSGVLKNALDWVSRTQDKSNDRNPFAGKTFLLMNASPGSNGAKGLVHLKDVLQALKGNVLEEQFALPQAYDKFDANGRLKDSQLEKQLKAILSGNITPAHSQVK